MKTSFPRLTLQLSSAHNTHNQSLVRSSRASNSISTMPVGIVEPKSGRHVPATARLFDDSIVPADGTAPTHGHLKHGSGSEADVLLVPQPSNSPNDPLVSCAAPSSPAHD